MAFNYQTLKNLSTESLRPNTVTGDDIGALEVKTANLANTTIRGTELANNSVDLNSGTVTGALSLARGGTGLSAVGSAYQALTVNSSNTGYTFAPTGLRRMVVYTGNSTWTKPSGTRFVHVQLVGGGGGGSGHGESGAAGGYSERILDVTSITSVGITIGGGGGGTYYSGAAGNGGTTSFGPYLSASGGHGANRHNQHNGGLSGVGSGGNINLHQGCGGGHEQRSTGMGGSTYFGGAGPAGHPQGGNYAYNHRDYAAMGTGGTSGYFSGYLGASGRPGIIIVTEYY